METKQKFTSHQKLVAFLCFAAYLLAYLIRINISIALPDIRAEYGLASAQTGLITSAFFWVYAVGQLVSGWLGDRISPRYMIGVGLAVSSILNVALSLCGNITAMTVIWAINGIFQSMLWAPIMRTIVLNSDGERLKRMTFLMSLTLVFGYAISWSASTIIKSFLGWRFVFIIPAFLAFAFAVVWVILYKNKQPTDSEVAEKKQVRLSSVKMLPVFLGVIVAACIVHGIIKESINVWLPTMLESAGTFSLSSTLGILLIVPLINFGGVMLMKFIMNRGKSNTYITLSILFALSLAIAAAAAVGSTSPYFMIIMTVLLSGLTFAINPVMTAYIPLDFAKYNCVSTIAGFIDCAIYVGAGLSGVLTGALLDSDTWTGVLIMWSIVALLGTGVSVGLKVLFKKIEDQ